MREATPYEQYARMVELHSLQFPVTDVPSEEIFILVSQVKELIFRMIFLELDQAREHLVTEDLLSTTRALGRANVHQRLLCSAWGSVNTIPIADFLAFRHVLGVASGTQSPHYRRLEYVLGRRPEGGTADKPVIPLLAAELERPSIEQLADLVVTRRTGLAPSEAQRAWKQVFESTADFAEEVALGECLMETAYEFSRWRSTHLLVVERAIGAKTGTAGTQGVAWLKQINEHRFFPALWNIRSEL